MSNNHSQAYSKHTSFRNRKIHLRFLQNPLAALTTSCDCGLNSRRNKKKCSFFFKTIIANGAKLRKLKTSTCSKERTTPTDLSK